MYVFEGKTNLRKIFEQYERAIYHVFANLFIDTTDTFRSSKEVDCAAGEVACKLTWKFLEDYFESYVLIPSGQFILLEDVAWVPPIECYQPLNGLINLKSGLLQSSDQHMPYHTAAACAEILAPFEGCPVFLNDDDDLLFDGVPFSDFQNQGKFDLKENFETELNEWYELRSDALEIARPKPVEVEYIDWEQESPYIPVDGITSLFLAEQKASMKETLANSNRKEIGANNQTISDCVMSAFPSGKGSAIWDEVEAKVGYSRRSIVRALRSLNQYERWAKSGQT